MLSGNTKILTVYHGPMTIDDIYKEGKNVLVYSWDKETKLPVVRMTREINQGFPQDTSSIKQVSLIFDSGLSLTTTLNHNLFAFRGDRVPATECYVGQSIRAFSLSIHPIDRHLRAHGWVDGKAKHQYVARLVWECFNGKIENGLILHHKDFNEINNKLDNLELLTVTEHNRVHYPFRKNKGFFKRNHKITGKFYLDEFLEYHGYMYDIIVDRTNTLVIADDNPVAGNASGIVVEN